jgi:hypothetical protein
MVKPLARFARIRPRRVKNCNVELKAIEMARLETKRAWRRFVASREL